MTGLARGLAVAIGIAVTMLVSLPPAAALSQTFRTCLAAARSEPANAACARAELARQETALARAWAGARGNARQGRDARHLALLDRAQARWLTWRQAHCDFVAGRAAGSTAQRYWGSRCRARLAQRRVITLLRQAKAYTR